MLYPARFLITVGRKNKIFHDKTRFKQYLSTNPGLQKVLEREGGETRTSMQNFKNFKEKYHLVQNVNCAELEKLWVGA